MWSARCWAVTMETISYYTQCVNIKFPANQNPGFNTAVNSMKNKAEAPKPQKRRGVRKVTLRVKP